MQHVLCQTPEALLQGDLVKAGESILAFRRLGMDERAASQLVRRGRAAGVGVCAQGCVRAHQAARPIVKLVCHLLSSGRDPANGQSLYTVRSHFGCTPQPVTPTHLDYRASEHGKLHHHKSAACSPSRSSLSWVWVSVTAFSTSHT